MGAAISELLVAEADELIWAALVQHGSGALELVGYDGNAMALSSVDQARDFEQWLVSDLPIACDDFVRAGFDPLDCCDRCVVVAKAA